MTLEEFRNLPSVIADFDKFHPAIDAVLVDHLIASCANAKGENAAMEVGGQKAIANIINFLRSAADKDRKPAKKITMKPLRRFAGEQKKDGENTKTP